MNQHRIPCKLPCERQGHPDDFDPDRLYPWRLGCCRAQNLDNGNTNASSNPVRLPRIGRENTPATPVTRFLATMNPSRRERVMPEMRRAARNWFTTRGTQIRAGGLRLNQIQSCHDSPLPSTVRAVFCLRS
jgi:hypothetical protein